MRITAEVTPTATIGTTTLLHLHPRRTIQKCQKSRLPNIATPEATMTAIAMTLIEARVTVVREGPDVEVVQVIPISDGMEKENVNLLDDVELVTMTLNWKTRETKEKLRCVLAPVAEKPEQRP
jgi:hypothetical protein